MSPECSVFLIKVLVLLLIYCSTSFSCAVSNKFHLTTRSAFETSCHTLQACEDTDCECTSAAVRGCQDLISGCDEHKIASLTTSLCSPDVNAMRRRSNSFPSLYLDFSEGYGSTLYDSSGNNFTATINGATWQTSGCFNDDTCLHFDNDNDYVDVPLGAFANLSSTQEISISMWTKSDMPCESGEHYLFDSHTNSSDSDVFEVFYLDAYIMWFTVGDDSGVASFALTGLECSDLSNWHYWTYVFNGVHQDAYIYWDGVRVAKGYMSRSIGDPAWFTISSASRSFGGLIDEFSVTLAALSPDDVYNNFESFGYVVDSGSPPTVPAYASPSLYLDFSEGSGSTLNDLSGNNFHASFDNAEWKTSGCMTEEEPCLLFSYGCSVNVPVDSIATVYLVQEVTISLWAKASTDPTSPTYLFMSWTKFGSLSVLSAYYNSSSLGFYIGDGSTSDFVSVSGSDCCILSDDWHYWTFVLNGTAAYIYKDGVEVAAKSNLVYHIEEPYWFTISDGVSPWVSLQPPHEPFDGWIDEFSVSLEAMSPSEVYENFASFAYVPVPDDTTLETTPLTTNAESSSSSSTTIGEGAIVGIAAAAAFVVIIVSLLYWRHLRRNTKPSLSSVAKSLPLSTSLTAPSDYPATVAGSNPTE